MAFTHATHVTHVKADTKGGSRALLFGANPRSRPVADPIYKRSSTDPGPFQDPPALPIGSGTVPENGLMGAPLGG